MNTIARIIDIDMRICSIGDCGGEHFSLGYCSTHYQRARKGRPIDGPVKRRKTTARFCVHPGCDRRRLRKGYCKMHHCRSVAGSDMDAPCRVVARSMEERLERYTAPPNENGCRIWTAALSYGYGVTTGGIGSGSGKRKQAHRAVYEYFSGDELTPRDAVHHKCGVRACVEFTHLQKITPAENSAEMLERTWYKRRIADLEQALGEFDQGHVLLNS